MEKKYDKIDQIAKKRSFKTPEGYFDNLTERIMNQLPEQQTEEPKVINLWERIKPWVYMAAMFAGMALIIKIFVSAPDKSSANYAHNGGKIKIEKTLSREDIDDIYDYYEERAATMLYEDAYLND